MLLITQMSLIYMNTTNAIQQSLYSGGSWIESLIYQASTPPADDTRPSVFTQAAFNWSENISVPLYSVAVYQYNKSLVMIQISPDRNIVRDPHVNYNSLSSITISQDLAYTEVGFACITDQLPLYNRTKPSNMYLRCFVGDKSDFQFDGVNTFYRAFSGVYSPREYPSTELNRNNTWEYYCKFISLRLFIHTCSD